MRPEYQYMALAWLAVIVWVAFVIFMNRKNHPKALFQLFMVELWERFSYYGMRALLILYLVSEVTADNPGFGIDKGRAYGIYAAYGALVYLTPLLGGLIADKILGIKNAIFWGAALMAAGQFTLSASTGSHFLLYSGLALLVIGNGFFKPNISSLIGRLYPAGDPRRDGAFTIFYMGINIGAFLTPLTCGTVGELEGWHYGFLLAGIGMVAGFIIFWFAARSGEFGTHADQPATLPEVGGFRLTPNLIYALTIAFLPVLAGLMIQNDIMDVLLGTIGLSMVAFMLWLSSRYEKVERERIWVIVLLLFFTTVFWTFFELAGSALNVFTDENVAKEIWGIPLTTTSFQSFNPFFIMLFAPIFAWMWVQMSRRNLEPSAPVKFAWGLLLLAAGFFIIKAGTPFAVEGMMPAIFMVALYFLHTMGELSLSPVGLSLVTKMAPARLVGFMMGFWFLSSAIAHQAGKLIAKETVADPSATREMTMNLSIGVFSQVGMFALGAGIFLLILAPVVKKWMHMDVKGN
jgi:POT family proton-dependent oligopeptide transporter